MANLKVTTSFQEYSLPSSSRSGNYTAKWAQQDLEYLNEKLNRFSRQTSQWDLYKITEVIENKENYQAQINSLPPYSSAIVNSKFQTDDNESLNKGDLVYKNIDGTTTHIAAERGGVFYPKKITKSSSSNSNTYDIVFQYVTSEPVSGNDTEVSSSNNIWEVSGSPSQRIVFEDISVGASSVLYGNVFNPKTDTMSFTKKDVFPIIKMYNSDNEEVYCDYRLNISGSNYLIEGTPDIVTKIVVK